MARGKWHLVSSPLRDKRRLRIAFFFSILLHVLVLSHSKPIAEMAQKGGGVAVLTVTLPPVHLSEPKDKPIPAVGAVIALRSPSKKAIRLPVNRKRDVDVPPAPSGIEGSQVTSNGRGKIKVLLVIDSSGKVQHIHWNQLPAMTDEELINLEQRLRQKIYLPNGVEYTVTEQVE